MAEEDWLGFPFMPPREDDDEEVEGVIESTANGFQGLGADSRHEF